MIKNSPTLQQIVAHAKAYGFLYPSSEIYEGLQAVYDYGPYGVMLKRNIEAFWWQGMIRLHPNIVGLDAAVLMEPRTWQASGHVEGFNDWMIDHKVSRKRYRVDVLIEEEAARLQALGEQQAAKKLLDKMVMLMKREDGTGLMALLVQSNICCPVGKTPDWTQAKQFNLMFSTHIGSTQEATTKVYLRPETAQGIFVNFLNVQKTTRQKVPFGIAQIGKAFRNEVGSGPFIFKMLEFIQMEMQYFIPAEMKETCFAYWTNARMQWYQALGIHQHHLKICPHEHLAHYAKAAVDIAYHFPFGYKEIEGIHARGDFDLQNHHKLSGKNFAYFDPSTHTSYVPHVIETSAGCDRVLLMLLCEAFKQQATPTGQRTYLQLPPPLAPVHAAILPLIKKEGLAEYAQKVFDQLKYHFSLLLEVNHSIGKRYARQDLLGTPYCFTIDHTTLEDGTLTVRDRNTMEQTRIHTDQIKTFLSERVLMHTLLKKITSS